MQAQAFMAYNIPSLFGTKSVRSQSPALPPKSFPASQDVFVPRLAFGQHSAPPAFIVEPATKNDAPALANLNVEGNKKIPGADIAKEEGKRNAWVHNLTRRVEHAYSTSTETMVQVAKNKDDGKQIGYLSAELQKDGNLLLKMSIVDPEHRRNRAVIRQLGLAASKWAKKSGYQDTTTLQLYVPPRHVAAKNFYAQLGFSKEANPNPRDYKLMMTAPLGTVRKKLDHIQA